MNPWDPRATSMRLVAKKNDQVSGEKRRSGNGQVGCKGARGNTRQEELWGAQENALKKGQRCKRRMLGYRSGSQRKMWMHEESREKMLSV